VDWFGINRPTRANILRFGKLSAWYLADAGANMVNTNSDKLLLGIITGPVSVAYYTLTKFIPAALQGLINRLILGIMPGVGKLIGLKDFEKVNLVRKNINRLSLLLTTAFGTTVILFNQSFLSAWVGKEHFAGNTVNALIMIMTIQDTFVRNDACIISATLDIKKKVYLTLIAGALFAGSGALLIYEMGITGLCISMMISRLFLFFGQRRVLTALIKTEKQTRSVASLRPFITTIVMLGAAFWLASNTGSVKIYQLIVLAPVAFGISLLLFFFLGLNGNDRQDFKKIFSSIKFFKSDTGFSKN
jgi:O-antigen/teichoic acid export membrane protein